MQGSDNPADDFRSKMLETDIIDCLLGLLQDQDGDKQQSSIKAITVLSKFGRLTLYHFVLCGLEDLMIQQTISAQRCWKHMSLIVLLVCLKVKMKMYNSHQ